MNNVIQKCVDELNKEAPRIDYIRGMLESLLVMNEPSTISGTNIRSTVPFVGGNTASTITLQPAELSDEETTAIERYEKGPIGKITS